MQMVRYLSDWSLRRAGQVVPLPESDAAILAARGIVEIVDDTEQTRFSEGEPLRIRAPAADTRSADEKRWARMRNLPPLADDSPLMPRGDELKIKAKVIFVRDYGEHKEGDEAVGTLGQFRSALQQWACDVLELAGKPL